MFEYPEEIIWQERRDWIDKELENAEIGLVYDVSDHAVALFMDMSTAYCAGAWLSVIVMAISVIDAHLRETQAIDDKVGTAKLLSNYYEGDNIDWLRKLRNSYVHVNDKSPLAELNFYYKNQDIMKANAGMAIKMAINALFQNTGI